LQPRGFLDEEHSSSLFSVQGDWNIINMSLVPDFLSCVGQYLSSYGFALPKIWTGPGADASGGSNGADVDDGVDSFLRAEEAELKAFHLGLLSRARAARTLRNYRLPALKLLWFAYTRRWLWPPAPNEFGLYLAKLYKDRDNVGAPTTTKSAMSLLCSMNDIDGAPYSTLRTTAAIDAARREHKHVTKKSAGLTISMVAAINRRYSFERAGRALNEQWEFAVGTAISLAFKILLRYDDLARCLWDPDFCDIFYTHVRYYVEGRKNDAHGCAFLDVARPAGDNPAGVYFLLVRAKRHFRTGFAKCARANFASKWLRPSHTPSLHVPFCVRHEARCPLVPTAIGRVLVRVRVRDRVRVRVHVFVVGVSPSLHPPYVQGRRGG
jgi:hypothetical protein